MIDISDDEKYLAVINNDATFDDIFYYAVKSTGIYCRPSCKSRPPKRENTLFFNSASEAQNTGFRACKRCRSDLSSYQPIKSISFKVKALIDNMFAADTLLNDELSKLGLSYRQLAEVFKSEYGKTPKAYVDELRINEAKRQLAKTNNTIIDISMSIGFSSLSAFYRFFKENTGYTPGLYRKDNKE